MEVSSLQSDDDKAILVNGYHADRTGGRPQEELHSLNDSDLALSVMDDAAKDEVDSSHRSWQMGDDIVLEHSDNMELNSNGRGCHGNGGVSPESKVFFERAAAFKQLMNIQKEYHNEKKLKRKVKRFYKEQDEFINAIKEAEEDIGRNHQEAADELKQSRKAIRIAAQLSFFANVVLMIAKLTASILSGSMAILSSLVDSVVDLVSGAVIFYTTRAARKANLNSYPFGRTRLEPAAIIIISVVMGLASIQVVIQSLKQLLSGDIPEPDYQWQIINSSADPQVGWVSRAMVLLTIVVKLGLFLFCRRIPSPSTRALATDHFNDVIGNSFALACGWVGSSSKQLNIVDPIGAILISIYICYNWYNTGTQQMQVITGRTAPPATLAKIVWLSIYHHDSIRNIDTVRAFHLGSGFLADVHVTLDENMSLKEAHDIGESLQNKLELLLDVEVAFVHLDYENMHKASSEHAFLMPRDRIRTLSSNSTTTNNNITSHSPSPPLPGDSKV